MTQDAAAPFLKVSHIILTSLFALLGIFGIVKAMGSDDGSSKQVVVDHERRIILLEQKFERMMEKQGEMVGDIKVIRTYVENSKEKNQ
jgi:hypothetical protein